MTDGAKNSVTARPGESLTGIVSRLKPAGVTVEQAAVATYRANSAAFMGSINLLRLGATLTLPDASCETR